MKSKLRTIYVFLKIRSLKRKLIRHHLRYLRFYVYCIMKIGEPKNEQQREILKQAFDKYDATLIDLIEQVDSHRIYTNKKF